MLPEMEGPPFTAMQRDEPDPQALLANTQTLPVVNEPKVTLMEVEFCPELMVAPGGTLQV